jgi:conjugal transfer pilus assembly protein TraW
MVMTFKKTGYFSLVLLLLSPPLYCKNLGVFGAVFDIKEKDMIETIQQKLSAMEASGTLAYHQNQLLEKANNALQTPHPVSGLSETVTPRTFEWNPSITFPMDIKNHQNQLIYKKGTLVNPLDTVSFKGQWLFFNGEDDKQKAWAKSLYKMGDKLILVRGSPLQLMRGLQLPVYFDQQGLLTRKIGIQQIPARVYQEGQVLKVEEIRLTEKPS